MAAKNKVTPVASPAIAPKVKVAVVPAAQTAAKTKTPALAQPPATGRK